MPELNLHISKEYKRMYCILVTGIEQNKEDLMPFWLRAGRLKSIQQISQKLIWKNYFHRLRRGKRKSYMIDMKDI